MIVSVVSVCFDRVFEACGRQMDDVLAVVDETSCRSGGQSVRVVKNEQIRGKRHVLGMSGCSCVCVRHRRGIH